MSTLPYPPFPFERPPRSVASGCHNHPAVDPGPPTPNEAAAAGHARLETVFRAQHDRLARYFRAHVDADAAVDLAQEAFARLANTGKVDQLGEPVAYLWRVARNLLFERSRKQKRHNVVLISLEDHHEPVIQPEQEQRIEAADMLRLYEAAVDAMPPKTRRVYLMQRVDELSYRDIHERLGISIATVEYHMMKALAHIERALDAGR